MRFWDEPFETMPFERMRELQLTRLRETVRWVSDRVPFYRKALEARGVKAGDIERLDDIRRLPFTVKTDLRDNYPFGLCAVPRQDLVRVHASSGTTGKPITGPYTAEDLSQWTDCMARTLYAHGVRPDDVAQNAYGMGLFTGGLGFFQGALEDRLLPGAHGARHDRAPDHAHAGLRDYGPLLHPQLRAHHRREGRADGGRSAGSCRSGSAPLAPSPGRSRCDGRSRSAWASRPTRPTA